MLLPFKKEEQKKVPPSASPDARFRDEMSAHMSRDSASDSHQPILL
jgi:hypothetical protein